LDFAGRNEANLKVIFPAESIPETKSSDCSRPIQPGDYVVVEVSLVFGYNLIFFIYTYLIYRLRMPILSV